MLMQKGASINIKVHIRASKPTPNKDPKHKPAWKFNPLGKKHEAKDQDYPFFQVRNFVDCCSWTNLKCWYFFSSLDLFLHVQYLKICNIRNFALCEKKASENLVSVQNICPYNYTCDFLCKYSIWSIQ